MKIASATQKRFLDNLERKYAEHLHKIVDEIYEAAYQKYTWMELAEEAGVSYMTVANLGNRKTLFPRHMTVWKLAKAVGLNYQLSEIQPPAALRKKAG